MRERIDADWPQDYCDVCGERHPVEEITYILVEPGVTDRICKRCQAKEMVA